MIHFEGQSERSESKASCCVVHCCSTSSSSSSSAAEEFGFVGSGKFGIDRKGEFKYLVSEFGWKVRSLFRNGDEEKGQLKFKLKHSMSLCFSSMISSSNSSRPKCFLGLYINLGTHLRIEEDLMGVVDVTMSRDRNVLQHLPSEVDTMSRDRNMLQHLPSEEEEYLYVSR